jgi:hypothetical protein
MWTNCARPEDPRNTPKTRSCNTRLANTGTAHATGQGSHTCLLPQGCLSGTRPSSPAPSGAPACPAPPPAPLPSTRGPPHLAPPPPAAGWRTGALDAAPTPAQGSQALLAALGLLPHCRLHCCWLAWTESCWVCCQVGWGVPGNLPGSNWQALGGTGAVSTTGTQPYLCMRGGGTSRRTAGEGSQHKHHRAQTKMQCRGMLCMGGFNSRCTSCGVPDRSPEQHAYIQSSMEDHRHWQLQPSILLGCFFFRDHTEAPHLGRASR